MQPVPENQEDHADQLRDELALKRLQPLVDVTEDPVIHSSVEVCNYILWGGREEGDNEGRRWRAERRLLVAEVHTYTPHKDMT